MLLRRITEHVKAQNWTAIGLDFIIVVVGVFIGIQVANWNETQSFNMREKELLRELKREIETSIRVTNQKGDSYQQVVEAGVRSLAFIEAGAPCRNECWPVLVDFFHASQWQDVWISRSTYDEMRRLGLPRSRTVIDAVEVIHRQNVSIANVMEKPVYRSLVRRMIPLAAQVAYWSTCYELTDGAETYVLDCAKGVPDDVAARSVDAIVNHPDVAPYLTAWVGHIVSIPASLEDQNAAAVRAIAAIAAELETR